MGGARRVPLARERRPAHWWAGGRRVERGGGGAAAHWLRGGGRVPGGTMLGSWRGLAVAPAGGMERGQRVG